MKNLIILILVIIIGAGAFFWYRTTSQNQGAFQTTALAPKDNGVKEYHSDKFQISFQYPASWSFSESEPGLVILKPNAKISDDLAPISIDVRGVEPYQDAIREIRSDILNKDEKNLTFGRYQAVAISGNLNPAIGEHPNAPVSYTMIDHAGALYSIDYSEFDSSQKPTRDVYQQIVASFKFTEPTR